MNENPSIDQTAFKDVSVGRDFSIGSMTQIVTTTDKVPLKRGRRSKIIFKLEAQIGIKPDVPEDKSKQIQDEIIGLFEQGRKTISEDLNSRSEIASHEIKVGKNER